MADNILEEFKMIESNAYKLAKKQYTDLYKDRAESDVESFDCQLDMEQHIRGLEFRRMGCEMQLDKVKQASNHAIEEIGNVKDLRNTDITSNSTDDRDYKHKLWTSKFNIYNNRVKAIKEVYQELHKKTYVKYGGVDINHNARQRNATMHFNKPIEENIQANIAETLATKH
tara:strand:+ start:172 stop:684 length:513 start_codon:yes stop_codon:yes gene_type:complete